MATRDTMLSAKITAEQYQQLLEIKYQQRVTVSAIGAWLVEYGLNSDDALRFVKQKAEEYRTDKKYNRRILYTNFDEQDNEKEDS